MKKLSIFIIGILLSSCTAQFLDVPSEGAVTPDDPDEKTARETVIAIYNSLTSGNTHGFPWIGVSSITSDDADKGSEPGQTGNDKHLLDDFLFQADANSFNQVWLGNFQGINRANRSIEIVGNIEGMDEDEKNELLAEGHFLRAFFYWNLVRCFGPMPIINFVPDPNNPDHKEAAYNRVPVEEVYDFIESDLEFAIEHLPLRSAQERNKLGRATRGSAMTFLAKLKMYQQDWVTCKNLTDEIINSGEYSLTPDFTHIWREIGENNEESIFEVQARGEPPFVGINQYTEVQGVRNQWGWGFNTPSQDLVDSFEEGDIRKTGTLILPGEVMWDEEVVLENTVNPYYNKKAYISRVQESWGGNEKQTSKNLRVFRYAEVLLMNAEASFHVGGDATAKINQLRERAGLEPLTGINSIDQIWQERRVELAFEHDRFFDLVRQGRAAKVLHAHGKVHFKEGIHEIFPIPINQINLSGGRLKQNPGY